MNIFISGSNSLFAAGIIEACFNRDITLFLRDELPENKKDITQALDKTLAGQTMDVVMLLHGEDVFAGSMTKKRFSRVTALKLNQAEAMCAYFAGQDSPPKLLLLASSVHIYRKTGEFKNTEESKLGTEFPATYYQKLESLTSPVEKKGTRVVHLRLGSILSRFSPPLFPRLPLLTHHIPVVWQDKKRKVNWISLEDALRAVFLIIDDNTLKGPVNIAIGDAVEKASYNQTIADGYKLRLTLPLQAFLLKILLGKERAELFFSDSNAFPARLLRSGFRFNNTSLQDLIPASQELPENS